MIMKGAMKLIDDLGKTIEYIENNLLKDININTISKHVGISAFYLQRSFQILTGYSMGEYIRNRRLYLAAKELNENKPKIIDVAYKYGYETPESFTKAFIKFHNNKPSNVKNGGSYTSFNRIRIKISIEQGEEMNFKITPMFPIKLIGFEKEFDMETSKEKIPKFWDEICAKHCSRIYAGLEPVTPEEHAVVDNCIGEYALCMDENGDKTFKYMLAGRYTGGNVPEGMKLVELDRGDWAVFDCYGPNPKTLQETTKKVYDEWLPNNSEYELRKNCCVEWYDCTGDMNDENYHSAIWLPIKKK